MGRYDFSCNMGYETSQDNGTRYVTVICYWKNNGWKYHMQPIYGWVTCNGEERCVYNAGYPDFRSDNQGQYELGRSSFSYGRGHSTYSVGFSARLRSDSSYASGERWSSSGSVNVDAKTHTTITYNANGGTGAPGNQDKWYGEQMWLSGTKPSRTGYNFNHWSASSGGNYSPGQEYTADPGGTVTMTAQWSEITYQVSYNANGGSGAPAAQTKRYTANLTLSSTKPTRSGYIFKGWATSASGAVLYQPGGTYSNNAAVTLYAVWEVAYKKPTISNFSVFRCNSAGTASDTGTYVKVAFSWTTFYDVEHINIDWADNNNFSNQTCEQVTASGKSGSATKIAGGGNMNIETTYFVRIWVKDNSGGWTLSNVLSVGTVKFPIDVKKGGKGVAVGKVAETDNLFDVGWNARFRNGINIEGTNNVVLTMYRPNDFNNWDKQSSIRNYYNEDSNKPNGDFPAWGTLLTLTGLDNNYSQQIAFGNWTGNGRRIAIRSKVNNDTPTSWDFLQMDPVDIYNNATGTAGTVTLSESAGNFRYLEIFYRDKQGNYPGYNSVKVYSPNGKRVDTTTIQKESADTNTSLIRINTRSLTISGTSITVDNYQINYVPNSGRYRENEQYVVRVLGYR